MGQGWRIGGVWVRPWRGWVLAASWALGAGLFVAAALLLASHRVERFNPDDPQALALRARDAQVELERGSPEVAQERLEALRIEDPMNPWIHAQLGLALGRVPERLPEGIASLRMAVTLDPLFTEAWYNLACLYARANDRPAALQALAEAVSLGFSDRAGVRRDADLAVLLPDPRVAYFLAGGRLPVATRFAAAAVEPEAPRVGDPFDLVMQLWDLDARSAPPDFRLEFQGPSQSRLFAPVARTAKALGEPATGHGWELRFRLLARGPYRGNLGPWGLRISGAPVPLGSVVLHIAEGTAAAPSAGPPFAPRAFFSAPFPPVDATPGARWRPAEGAFPTGALALEVAPWPPDGPRGLLVGGLDEAPPAGWDEWVIPAVDQAPTGLRRVLATPDAAATVARARVTLQGRGIPVEAPPAAPPPVGDPPP